MNALRMFVFSVILLQVNSLSEAQDHAPARDTALLRIGLISDPQYCDCDPSGERIYREVLKKLPVAIDSMNKFQVDFVMNLGDMIDRDYESYDSILHYYGALHMPYYNLLGNHEFENIPDTMMPSLLERYGMPDFYYAMTYKNWRFLVLDGTELAAYSRNLHPALAEEGDSLFQLVQDSINNRPWNGGIGRAQRAWITEQIQEAFTAKQLVILFCHFPVYPDTIYLNLWNDDEMVRLIGDHSNVIAYINGHYHAGNYGYSRGIHFVNQAAMLDTYEHNSFSVLNIYADRLEFRGFGLNPDRILPYTDPFSTPQLSFTDRSANPKFRIFPNPARDLIYIQAEDYLPPSGARLVITDATGREIMETPLSDRNNSQNVWEIRLNGIFLPGAYLLILYTGSDKVLVEKIIVE